MSVYIQWMMFSKSMGYNKKQRITNPSFQLDDKRQLRCQFQKPIFLRMFRYAAKAGFLISLSLTFLDKLLDCILCLQSKTTNIESVVFVNYLFIQAAFFIFFTASTRTWIVAANFIFNSYSDRFTISSFDFSLFFC